MSCKSLSNSDAAEIEGSRKTENNKEYDFGLEIIRDPVRSPEAHQIQLVFCHMRDRLFIDLQNEISIIPFHKTFLTQLLFYGSKSYSVPINTFLNEYWKILRSFNLKSALVFPLQYFYVFYIFLMYFFS